MNLTLIFATMLTKLKMTALYAVGLSFPTFILAQLKGWYIDNQMYVIWVLIAIIADHIIGSIFHKWWLKDFEWKHNLIGFVVKVGLAVLVGLLFEGLNYLITGDSAFISAVKDWTVLTLRLTVFLYPTSSALQNVDKMTNGKFPFGIFTKLKSFRDTGDINDLK